MARQGGHCASVNEHEYLGSGLKRFLEIFQAALFTTPRRKHFIYAQKAEW